MSTKPQTSDNFSENDDIYDEDYTYTTRECKLGYYISLTPKFYFADEDEMDGTYLGFNFQYRKYKYLAYGEVNPLDQTDIVSSVKDVGEFENQTILSLRWGSQSMNDKTIIDYYIGAGIRNYKGERRDLGYQQDLSGSSFSVLGKNPRSTKGTKLFFEVGMNIGLWWDKK